MEKSLKIKTLKSLAERKGEAAEAALLEELSKINDVLKSETDYHVLEEAIEFLKIFAYRHPKDSCEILSRFVSRTDELQTTIEDSGSITSDEVAKYFGSASIAKEAIEGLIQLRYQNFDTLLPLFVDLSLHEQEKIKKKAIEGLKQMSEFNIHVFRGTEKQGGVGPAPQTKIIEYLKTLSSPELLKYFDAVLTLCKELFSPTMQGGSSTYDTFTISTADIPPMDQISTIRTGTIEILGALFNEAETANQKIQVINHLSNGTRAPGRATLGSEIRQIIEQNTIDILNLFARYASGSDFSIVQKIEHHSFHIYRIAVSEDIVDAALRVEIVIAKNQEYQIFRDLVGFEGIFGQWSELAKSHNYIRLTDDDREVRVLTHVKSVKKDSAAEWQIRIVEYAKTESDDSASFQYFYKFLEELAKSYPSFAFQLLQEEENALKSFLIPLLRGLWAGEKEKDLRELIDSWIADGKYLSSITKSFMGLQQFEVEILSRLIEVATKINDITTIDTLISLSIENYSFDPGIATEKVFLPAISALTSLNDSSWVFDNWFRKNKEEMFKGLSKEQIVLVLENLITAPNIDYHFEAILSTIAETYPQNVVELFGKRIEYEKLQTTSSTLDRVYEAIPFDFSELNETLNKIPELVVSEVRKWYDGDYGQFIYRGAKFIRNIFPKFSETIEAELINITQKNTKDDHLFVLAVLRSYDGQDFIYNVCKELVSLLSEDDELLKEVAFAIMSTGVVSGEYGFADAFRDKSESINTWLEDENPKIQNFARKLIDDLTDTAARETERADEEIAIRKIRFGEN
jgi:hypothetical protein